MSVVLLAVHPKSRWRCVNLNDGCDDRVGYSPRTIQTPGEYFLIATEQWSADPELTCPDGLAGPLGDGLDHCNDDLAIGVVNIKRFEFPGIRGWHLSPGDIRISRRAFCLTFAPGNDAGD